MHVRGLLVGQECIFGNHFATEVFVVDCIRPEFLAITQEDQRLTGIQYGGSLESHSM